MAAPQNRKQPNNPPRARRIPNRIPPQNEANFRGTKPILESRPNPRCTAVFSAPKPNKKNDFPAKARNPKPPAGRPKTPPNEANQIFKIEANRASHYPKTETLT